MRPMDDIIRFVMLAHKEAGSEHRSDRVLVAISTQVHLGQQFLREGSFSQEAQQAQQRPPRFRG